MSINDFLTSEMSVWIEIILLGLCFLCGVAVIVLGVIFTSRKHSSRLLGGILILNGSAYALSIGHAFVIIILSRTSGQETIHTVSNIYTYAGMLLNLAKYVLLLVFCRVVMKCKVWVIPVSACYYLFNCSLDHKYSWRVDHCCSYAQRKGFPASVLKDQHVLYRIFVHFICLKFYDVCKFIGLIRLCSDPNGHTDGIYYGMDRFWCLSYQAR